MSLFSKPPGSRRRAAKSSFASWTSLDAPAFNAANGLFAGDGPQDEMSAPELSLDGYFRLIEEARAGGIGWVQAATELRPPFEIQA